MKKKYISSTLLLISLSITKAQTDVKDIINKNTPNVTTPDLTRFLRYNDFPNVEFIGATNIEVPIYSIKLNDLEIPIKLTYNTKGNKVSEIASNVGLGWMLTANGNISKQVNDIEDFSFHDAPFLEDPHSQFEPAGPVDMRITRGYFENQVYNVLSPDFKIDSSPDSYIVNAPGLKTKFYLQKDPTICPQNNCSISTYRYIPKFLDVNSYKIEPLTKGTGGISSDHGDPSNAFQKIVLYNGKGYEYNFINPSGTSLTKPWEYNYNFRVMMGSRIEDRTNTWYLDYIKSPANQKKIEYIYEDYTINYENPVIQRSDEGFGQLGLTSTWFKEGTAPTPNWYGAQDINYTDVIYTKNFGNKRLKKINFEEGSVDFYYNTRQDYEDKSLNKIQIMDKSGKIIKIVDFYYSYFLPKDSNCSDDYNCLRLRLDKIVDSNSGEYRFNYGINNSDNLFPQRYSSKTDYQGYFNDNNSDIPLNITEALSHRHDTYYPMPKMYYYPDLIKDNFLPFKLNGITNFSTVGDIDKTPNEKSLIGLLSRITYPSNGSLAIEYENDDFEYLGTVYKAGSARVKKMKYYGNDGNIVRQIEYSYKNENNLSSGQINYFKPPIPTHTTVVTSYEIPLEFNKDGIVGYSRIEEIESGKGKKVKKYSNISDFPDNLPVINPDGCSLTANEISMLKKYKFPFKNLENFSNRRGNLIYEGYFKENSTSPIYEAFNTYDYYEKTKLKLSNIVHKSTGINSEPGYSPDPGCSILSESYLITNQVNLTDTIKKSYYDQGVVQNDEQYIYDINKNQLKKTKKISSSGIIETNYKNSEDKGITKLINNNIIDDPLEIETIKKKDINDSGKAISKVETKYDDPATIYPTSTLSYDIQNNALSNEITYDKYDTKGNLQQYTTKNGIPITFIWGYNQTQPIAKIEGAKLLDISQTLITSIINASNEDAIPPQGVTAEQAEQNLISVLDTFRKDPGLKEYKITTYVYDPLIGVKVITSPTGLKEFYKYDTANRLEKVADLDGNILKQYTYNYSPTIYYNNQKSQNFTRNNCGLNAIGGAYTYIVNADQYSSIISQADANQKAQNDINANGQNMANVNGICTPISCSLSFNSSVGIAGGGSVSVAPNSYYRISFGFSSGSNSTNLPWTAGVKVATIIGSCKPITEYNSYNGQVYYTIKTNGDVTLKTHTGTALPNNTSYNYDFYFPIN
ncbi:DUF5977 domain-containing protein [Chryseobacterium sp. MIQD13]|uniref:DUF5977 domain-containing protein n=1 Tax=Chryseobacterium sp. MIQD13 TaxID=3422310 RepID=UPI003D29194F